MIEISGLARKMLTKIKLFLQDKNSAEAKFEMKPQVIPDMLITDNLCLNPKIVYALRNSVPIVSLQWVFDCIRVGRLFDPTPYLMVASDYIKNIDQVFNK